MVTIEQSGPRLYLVGLPFARKDEAKAELGLTGANFDRERGQWWCGAAKRAPAPVGAARGPSRAWVLELCADPLDALGAAEAEIDLGRLTDPRDVIDTARRLVGHATAEARERLHEATAERDDAWELQRQAEWQRDVALLALAKLRATVAQLYEECGPALERAARAFRGSPHGDPEAENEPTLLALGELFGDLADEAGELDLPKTHGTEDEDSEFRTVCGRLDGPRRP